MSSENEYEEEYEEEKSVGFFDSVDFDDEDVDIPDRYAMPEAEDLLEDAIEILAEARPLPMSATVKVNRDELLHILEQVQDRLPEELRAAKWLLKERQDFVAKARQEHKDLIEEGRAQVGRMVERQQVVKAAEIRARQIVSDARHEANNMQRQVEEFCDERLESFEQILERTAVLVKKGRRRMSAADTSREEELSIDLASETDEAELQDRHALM